MILDKIKKPQDGAFFITLVFMPNIPQNDIEGMNTILHEIGKNGVPYLFTKKMLTDLFDESYFYEADRLIRKLNKLGLIEYHKGLQDALQISDYAREIINEYDSYSNYISSTLTSKKKEDKKIIFDRVFKNGNIIAALLISSLSLVLTQCPIQNKLVQTKIEQELKSVAMQLDSLKQVLRNNQLKQSQQQKVDTATNK